MSFCICNHILCTTIDKDAHSQDLAAPHMDRVQLVMSWYTDGPGGGTEWYSSR